MPESTTVEQSETEGEEETSMMESTTPEEKETEGEEADMMRSDETTTSSSNEDTTEIKFQTTAQRASIGMFTRNNEDSRSNSQGAIMEISTQKESNVLQNLENDVQMSITHFDGEDYSYEEAEVQKDTTIFENGSGFDDSEHSQYQYAAGDYIETYNEPKKSKEKKTANLITRVKRQTGKAHFHFYMQYKMTSF